MRGTLRLTQGDQQTVAEEKPETQQPQAPKEIQTQASTEPVAYTKGKSKSFIITYVPELIRLLLAIIMSVAATTYIMITYFYRPVVILDLTGLVNTARQTSLTIKDDQQRVDYIANYFQAISNDLKKRKEIVIVKEAVLNPEGLKDITDEYKKEILPKKAE